MGLDAGRDEKLQMGKVAQIEFVEWTPDRHVRHSTFVGLKDDEDAREVV
ncbi:MAG TPA: hypothetical protein VIH18_24895 [Candidatus Binatia bacterium]|jgi:hypothetical protein